MRNLAIIIFVLSQFIGTNQFVFAQDPSVILTHLSPKNRPMLQRTESLYRVVETPQINELKTGYLLSYVDEKYNGHLLFLDKEFQLKKDVRLAKSGIVKACVANNEIVLLKCKYTYQKEGTDPYYWEHNLFFERYTLDGVRKSSTKLIGDQYYVKGRKNRTYRSKYESALIEHKGVYYVSFGFQFNRTKKYDSMNYQLIKIGTDNKPQVINSMYKHVKQSQLFVHKDTIYHICTQSRGPRAILLRKYSIKELSEAEVKEVEVGNSGKDIDQVISIYVKPINLFPITDGTDKKQFLCSDDHIPVRIENTFIYEDKLNLVLCTMQDRKTYDLILATYNLTGKKLKEIPLAANRYVQETSGYAQRAGDLLQMVYSTLDEKEKRPDTSMVMTYNLKTGIKTEHPIDAKFVTKSVFQFYYNYGESKLLHRDFRVNSRLYNHNNYNHIQTNDGMAVLNWNQEGIDVVRVIIP
jgi:hypothetical protein